MENQNGKAKTGILAVKEFFNFESTAKFREEWTKLTPEEQEWFKKAVEAELKASQ